MVDFEANHDNDNDEKSEKGKKNVKRANKGKGQRKVKRAKVTMMKKVKRQTAKLENSAAFHSFLIA